MKWEPVDLVVGAIIIMMWMLIIGAMVLRFLGVSQSSDEQLSVWENFAITGLAIITLYVGNRLNKNDECIDNNYSHCCCYNFSTCYMVVD